MPQLDLDFLGVTSALLASSLVAVISQVLCKKVGGGRIAGYEIMVNTTSIGSLNVALIDAPRSSSFELKRVPDIVFEA